MKEFKSRFKQFDYLKDFKNYELRSYIPTSFGESFGIEKQFIALLRMVNEYGAITDELIDYINDFIKNFDGNLEEIVREVMKEWYETGKFDDLFAKLNEIFNGKLEDLEKFVKDEILKFKKDVEKELERIKYFKKLFKPYENLDRQLVEFSMSATLPDSQAFVQGFSVNQTKKEVYVCRKINTEGYNYISVYDYETGEHKSTKKFATSPSAFNEGLPYFYNKNNQLCFLVRTSYDRNMAIYNYDLDVLSQNFICDGGSKINCDINKRYFIANFGDASKTLGVYIYDFQSVIDMNPQLIKLVRFDVSITYGEKVQSIGILDDKIVLCHGEQYPVTTVLNFNGEILESYEFSLPSLKEMVSTFDDCLTDQMSYENEGCYPYIGSDGVEYMMINHVFKGVGRAFFTVCGDTDNILVKRKTYSKNVRNKLNWIDIPRELMVNCEPYGSDVYPQYAYENDGHIVFRGVVTYDKDVSPSGDFYYLNKKLFTLPFPIVFRRQQYFKTVAGGNPERSNRIKVHTENNIACVTIESTSDSSTKPFCCLDGVRAYNDVRYDFGGLTPLKVKTPTNLKGDFDGSKINLNWERGL